MPNEQIYRLRLECLRLALECCAKPANPYEVVSAARQMFEFISDGVPTAVMPSPPSQDGEIPF